MIKETKDSIITKAKDYMQRNKISQNALAKYADIPTNYLSGMMSGKETVDAGGKDVTISDKYYKMLAKTIGYDLRKKYWKTRQTVQLEQILSHMIEGKENGSIITIIGHTGSGKSHVSDMFVKSYFKDTFKIKVGKSDTVNDVLEKLCDSMNITYGKGKSSKIRAIITKLINVDLEGGEPTLIIDESEFMNQSTICNVKEVIDEVKTHCGVIFLGTDQFLENIKFLKDRNRAGIPQFYSRIKFGIRYLTPVDTSFEDFIADIQDPNLVKFLQQNCDNYREFHDIVVPALIKAEKLNEPLTENLVRTMLNMPKRDN